MTLLSSPVGNLLFLIPLGLTLFYLAGQTRITAWQLFLALVFLAGATFRERWVFSGDVISYRFSLFFIPLTSKKITPREVAKIGMNAFLRGEKKGVAPGSARKWYQTEQGVLKLILRDGSTETILMETNRKNLRLEGWGQKIAAFLNVPFGLNEGL